MRRQSLTAVMSTVAQLAYAHGFFGNLYEATAKTPTRIAGDEARMPSLFSPGSPVRYYLPGVPITIGSTIGMLIAGWQDPRHRWWLATAGLSTGSAAALTGYLVPVVNRKLFVAGHPLTPGERDRLLRTWYRLNTVRIAALGIAWLSAQRVGARR